VNFFIYITRIFVSNTRRCSSLSNDNYPNWSALK
jgi:hypothetical protein